MEQSLRYPALLGLCLLKPHRSQCCPVELEVTLWAASGGLHLLSLPYSLPYSCKAFHLGLMPVEKALKIGFYSIFHSGIVFG